MIEFYCWSCGAEMQCHPSLMGTNVPCPKCKDLVLVPVTSVESENPNQEIEKRTEPRLDSVSEQEIEGELNKLYSKKKSLQNNLSTLILSLALFVGTGMYHHSISSIVMIVSVILFHELGHFIGMKAFGYRDVHMFFIPMFGAATSGEESNPSGSRKAIVSLLGPIPGMFLGLLFLNYYMKFKVESFKLLATSFLLINAFNLLPIYPLDGGQFFDSLLFSRNKTTELVMKLLTGILLLLAAVLMKSFILALLGIVTLISLRTNFVIADIANKLKPQISDADMMKERIPSQLVKPIKDEIEARNLFSVLRPKIIAIQVSRVWQRIRNRPPSSAATGNLLAVYFFSILFGIIFPITTFVSNERKMRQEKVEVVTLQDGSQQKRYSVYRQGKPLWWAAVSQDGFFDGPSEEYNRTTGVLEKKGAWHQGKWNGDWSYFDKAGNLLKVVTFDNGKFVSIKELKGGEWITKTRDSLSGVEKLLYTSQEKSKPKRIQNRHF